MVRLTLTILIFPDLGRSKSTKDICSGLRLIPSNSNASSRLQYGIQIKRIWQSGNFTSTSTKDVINCYRTRFQLEFCFKDWKHYADLNNCQSTNLRKLEFHRNTSFASITIAKAACKELGIPFSISSCKSIIHNAYMLNRFICVSALQPNPQVIDKLFKELVLFSTRAT